MVHLPLHSRSLLGRSKNSLLCLLGEHTDGVFGRAEANFLKDALHFSADVKGFRVPLAILLLVTVCLFTAQQAAAVVVGGARRLQQLILRKMGSNLWSRHLAQP
jgi:hypothetical protein